MGFAFALALHLSAAPSLASPCATRVDRASVVLCALAVSPEVEAASFEAAAARARVDAASTVLPSNPALAVSASRRTGPGDTSTLNWSGTLSQTIEVAGQRGLRIEAAGHSAQGGVWALRSARRAVAGRALIAYFDALSAEEHLALAERLAGVGSTLTRLAKARSQGGLSAPIDAAVAHAAGLQLLRLRAQAQGVAAARRAALAVALGLDPGARPELAGALTPLSFEELEPSRLLSRAEANRADLAELETRLKTAKAQVQVLERERLPSPTLSAFVQRDGFNELVWGAGLSFPIPVPAPLGHTNRAEIAEAEALAKKAAAELAERRRQVQLEVTARAATWSMSIDQLSLYDPARLVEAEALLSALAEEIGAGRIAAKDALTSEQALLELLEGHIEVRRAAAIASVELALAIGRDLEGGGE